MAEHFQTEIISFDSRQFYQEMSIGTAAPSAEQLGRVRHHFISDRSCLTPLNAGEYGREASSLLSQLFLNFQVLVAVGGSGLFLRALTEGFDDMGPSDGGVVRQLWTDFFREKGIAALQAEVRRRDPQYAKTADMNNHQRLIRALEVGQLSGKTYSEHRKGSQKILPCGICVIGLNPSRDVLHLRIADRIHTMMHANLEAEAHALYHLKHLKSLQTVGYTEWFQHFDGLLPRQQVAEQILFHTRSYARRQLTWFRKSEGVQWFEQADDPKILPHIHSILDAQES
jgi:tRNA dimethylallyltransferase